MAKYLFLLVVIFSLVLLPGCGGEKPATVENNKTAKTASKKVKKTKNVAKKQKTTKAVNEKGTKEKTADSGEKSKPDAVESEKNIIKSIKSLLVANTTFNTQNYGLSLDEPYVGYCKQTIDLVNATIETAEGTETIKGVQKELCAKDGANGKASGYYIRYITLAESMKANGLTNYTSYMIVAWPEKVGRTGTKVYIASGTGTIYSRNANLNDQGMNPPVKEWPIVGSEYSEWQECPSYSDDNDSYGERKSYVEFMNEDFLAVRRLGSFLDVNASFNTQHYGLSLDKPYYGYCKQTNDLVKATIETASGTENIRGVPKELCVDDGKNGKAGGYYFRYIVTRTSMKSDGLDNVCGFMVVAWPEKVCKTATKVYIASEQGTIYFRSAIADDEGNDPPVTEWPDVDDDGSGWVEFNENWLDQKDEAEAEAGDNVSAKDKIAVRRMKSLNTANVTFNSQKFGLSLDEPYVGYCRQTIDLVNATIETSSGFEKIRGVPKEICAKDGANGKAGGYYFRYIVLASSVKSNGLTNNTSYMIVAWPEKVGETGTKLYITSEQGIIYSRKATADDEGEEPPVTEWPDVDADGSEWNTIAD